MKYVELVDPELLKTSSEEGRDSVLYECSTFEVRKSTGESSSSRIIVVKKGVKVWVLPGTWALVMVIHQLDKDDQDKGYGTAIILAITEWLLETFRIKVLWVRTAGQGGAVNFWRWLNFRRQINSNMYELPLQDSDVPLSWDIPRPPAGNIDEGHMAGASSLIVPAIRRRETPTKSGVRSMRRKREKELNTPPPV